VPRDYPDNQQPEGSYRADWERAINGSRSASAYAPVPNASARGGYPQPQPRPIPQAQPIPQAYRPAAQRPLYPSSQAYHQASPRAYAPAPVPVAQAAPKRRRGHRHVSGWYIFISWVALFAWAGFIYFMSSHTSSELAQGIFGHIRYYIEQFVWTYYGYVEDPVSPICHFGEYFILGALLGNALHCHMPFIPATLLAIAACSGYGYTDEIHQLSVAGRMFDMEDWKIDTIAAAIGSVLMTFFYWIGSSREYDDEY
jgi:VanZ family protein